MFEPPMTDIVEVMIPNPTGETDRYGRVVTSSVVTTGRVLIIHKTIETNDGNRRDATAEIDLPTSIPIGYNYNVKYTDQLGNIIEADVLQINSSNDIANHVMYRTIIVG